MWTRQDVIYLGVGGRNPTWGILTGAEIIVRSELGDALASLET